MLDKINLSTLNFLIWNKLKALTNKPSLGCCFMLAFCMIQISVSTPDCQKMFGRSHGYMESKGQELLAEQLGVLSGDLLPWLVYRV